VFSGCWYLALKGFNYLNKISAKKYTFSFPTCYLYQYVLSLLLQQEKTCNLCVGVSSLSGGYLAFACLSGEDVQSLLLGLFFTTAC